MLHSVNVLKESTVHATDGSVGHIEDAYFDESEWVVRYLVVNTGPWIFGRTVLIMPQSVTSLHREEKMIYLDVTRKTVKESPDVDTRKPISRLKEEEFHDYYRLPVYWNRSQAWSKEQFPGAMPVSRDNIGEERQDRESEMYENSLRSAREMDRYEVSARGEALGSTLDFIVDPETWKIRYLVVARDGAGRKLTVLSPDWIRKVSWIESSIDIDMPREKIENSPDIESIENVSRDYEKKLYDYYEAARYW